MRNPVSAAARWFARQLARYGVIDAARGERTVDLAWPRVVTGVARLSQRLVDLAMVGAVLGPAAIAGLAFALAYWSIGNTLSLGLSGGTISQVSRRYGAGDHAAADLAIKQGVWVGLVMAVPLVAVFAAIPEALVGLLANDPATVAYGATYLRVASFAIVFEFLNKIASRTLVGADDAVTPMFVRGGGAVANVGFNAVFIYGLGMGVLGAALGTLFATILVTVAFVWGFLAGGLPGIGRFPLTISASGPYLDRPHLRELLSLSLPLMARRLAAVMVVFPILAIAAAFGPIVVAAFEVARQIRHLINAPNWGFGLAASSLVGQALGRGELAEARAYGRDVLRFSIAVFLVVSAVVLIAARPIAGVFADDPATIEETVPFLRIAAVSAVGFGIDGTATGVLRGSGDTRWPFYGKLLGLYGVMLPVASLALVTPLGITALYAAMFAETAVPAAVTYYRFRSGAWLPLQRGDATAPVD